MSFLTSTKEPTPAEEPVGEVATGADRKSVV